MAGGSDSQSSSRRATLAEMDVRFRFPSGMRHPKMVGMRMRLVRGGSRFRYRSSMLSFDHHRGVQEAWPGAVRYMSAEGVEFGGRLTLGCRN